MRILITGATGLVGQGVLRECLRADDVTAVTALGRHASGQSHAKLTDLICADFAELGEVENQLQPFDACLYCAGAPPLGTAENTYRHVTQQLTAHVARTLARLNPKLTFVYISGAHANPDSRMMMLRIKGQTERDLAGLPMTTVMFRPGGIQPVEGVQSPHSGLNTMYKFVGPLMGLGVSMMPGLMTTTERVGRAMLAVLRKDPPPAIVENAQINQLGA